jgi:hypothetical protein
LADAASPFNFLVAGRVASAKIVTIYPAHDAVEGGKILIDSNREIPGCDVC